MSSDGYLRPTPEGTLLYSRVAPGARATEIAGSYGKRALKLRVCAPPTAGRANAEVERFLAQLLALPRRSVSVRRGAASRDKTVLLREVDPHRVREALSPRPS